MAVITEAKVDVPRESLEPLAGRQQACTEILNH